jgi:hypothetical protein
VSLDVPKYRRRQRPQRRNRTDAFKKLLGKLFNKTYGK